MKRKQEILSGLGLNYLYVTRASYDKYLVLGTVVRAIGHNLAVRVILEDEETVSLLRKLKKLLVEDVLFINDDDLGNKVRLLVINNSNKDLGYWRQRSGVYPHIVATNMKGDFDLISKVFAKTTRGSGVLAITGTGKGKTTMSLGMSLEAALCGDDQLIISWLKEKKNEGLSWSIGEHYFDSKLKIKIFEIETTGLGFFGSPNLDRVKGNCSYNEHRIKAYEGMERVKTRIVNGFDGIIVLDEFVDTVKEIAENIKYPLIDLKDAREFLKYLLGKVARVVVTGRRVNDDWRDLVGDSIEIIEVKHPWKSMGLSAVPGLDF